ncbi:hypothetical protein [Leeia aquatica]|uniref:Uncharacterized protein n=1 Tax=Leeia aquatica TaxID=2725557 RepID=A0A847S332_9NEIS|nr:hypothetical protein [Leeia aquatica]NLR74174.1 hypothetical protein [Leeia aquatica]
MHDVYEIGLRTSISFEEMAKFLAEYLDLPLENVVTDSECWSEQWEGKDRVGVGLLESPAGLKTNISGFIYRPLDDAALEKMAKNVAFYFNSMAVIGDYRKTGEEGQGRFICYFPDGSAWEAVDDSDGAISDVEVLHPI